MTSGQRIEAEKRDRDRRNRRREEHGIDSVEDPAMTGNESAAVLSSHAPLHEGFEQHSKLAGARQQECENGSRRYPCMQKRSRGDPDGSHGGKPAAGTTPRLTLRTR